MLFLQSALQRMRTIRRDGHYVGQLRYTRSTACRRTAMSMRRNEQLDSQSEGQGGSQNIVCATSLKPQVRMRLGHSHQGVMQQQEAAFSDALLLLDEGVKVGGQLRISVNFLCASPETLQNYGHGPHHVNEKIRLHI